MKNPFKNLSAFFSKKTSHESKVITGDELGTFYMNAKWQELKDSPDAFTLTYEIWENKHPEKVKAGQMIPFHNNLLSSAQLDIQIPFWKSLAEGLSDPILSFQGDVGKGVVRGYQYHDKRAVAPANTAGHIIKPVFEKDINNFLIGYEGKSLIYHTSPFSPTLREEIEKLNNLLIRFFGGEDIRKALSVKEQLFHPETVVSKEDLNKIFSTADWEKQSERDADPATKPILTNEDGIADNRKTVLIIDDDPFLLKMYGIKYPKAGFNTYTLTTANGDLVQKVADIKPDIITLDIIMPGRDGLQALEILKKDERTKNIPVVMLTNQSSSQDIEQAKTLGATDYLIAANITPTDVIQTIKNTLSSPYYPTIRASIVNKGGKVEDIPLSKIRLDTPIRHKELPPELIERIKNWKKILFEVELIPLDKTIDDFRRDTHPEREIAIWEKIANAYQSYITNHSVDSLEIKKEVYRIAFDLSNGNVDLSKTPHLNNADVKELTDYFA